MKLLFESVRLFARYWKTHYWSNRRDHDDDDTMMSRRKWHISSCQYWPLLNDDEDDVEVKSIVLFCLTTAYFHSLSLFVVLSLFLSVSLSLMLSRIYDEIKKVSFLIFQIPISKFISHTHSFLLWTKWMTFWAKLFEEGRKWENGGQTNGRKWKFLVGISNVCLTEERKYTWRELIQKFWSSFVDRLSYIYIDCTYTVFDSWSIRGNWKIGFLLSA